CFFFSSRRRHTRFSRDWSSDVCSSDLLRALEHHVLEEVGEPGAVLRLGAKADAVVDRQGRDGDGVVGREHHPQAVVELLVLHWRSEERRVGKEGWAWWLASGVAGR